MNNGSSDPNRVAMENMTHEQLRERIDLIWSRAHIPVFADDAKTPILNLFEEYADAKLAKVAEEIRKLMEQRKLIQQNGLSDALAEEFIVLKCISLLLDK